MNEFITAFLFALIAGMSMVAGSCLVFIGKGANRTFMSVSLGFSAGVMICLSMMDIFPEACEHFEAAAGVHQPTAAAVGSFFCGIAFMLFIGGIISLSGHRHGGKNCGCIQHAEVSRKSHADRSGLMRAGIMTAITFAAHNFPEGLTTFISALQGVNVAVPMVIAIAIHNIPAGIAIAAPIYNASGSRLKALKYSFLSGLAEPVGAVAGWLALMPFMGDAVFGVMFASAAGIMIYISIDELLPSSAEYGSHKLSMAGFIAGMAVMAASLILL